MKLSILALTFFAALSIAALSTPKARQCSCKKVGDDYVCSGRTCPRMIETRSDFIARQCSCKKVGDDYVCTSRTCPRDLDIPAAVEARDIPATLEALQCSCKKVGDEYVCSGRTCPRMVETRSNLEARQCSCKKIRDEYVCSRRTCPRSEMFENMDELMKRGCSK
jgi:hypothetical protein